MKLLNLFDYEQAAAEVMHPPYYAYYAGGVAENITLTENRRAFERIMLRPKMLRDVSQIDTSTTIMGIESSMPVMIAPAAMHTLAHPDGEIGMARAAKEVDIIQVLSTMSTFSVDDVASVGHNLWFQLYVFREREITEHLIKRAEAAGCQALVVTLDVPTPGLRENLLRANFSTPDLPFPNFIIPGEPASHDLFYHANATFAPSLTWKDIEWLASLTHMPVWVKGILRGDDAKAAVDHGMAGIIVSNHGGRQLDTAIPTIDALPEIAEAVNGRCELILDSGVRRGTDIIKALALGAKAVMLGRPPLWGLAVNGQAGAADILNMIRNELENVMAQCGCPTLEDIDASLIVR